MTYENFNIKLKELNIGLSEFAKMVGMSYHSVTNWKLKGIPLWVDCLLYHYRKSKDLDQILNIVESNKKKD